MKTVDLMRLCVLVLGAALPTSCAPRWVHNDKNFTEYRTDLAACKRYETRKAEQGSSRLHYATDPSSDIFSAAWSKGEIEEVCMKDKGWRHPQPQRP
jgi:hypothetical protein